MAVPRLVLGCRSGPARLGMGQKIPAFRSIRAVPVHDERPFSCANAEGLPLGLLRVHRGLNLPDLTVQAV